MKDAFLQKFAGILLIIITSLVMLGWLAHIPSLINIFQGQVNMVFNTAVCFFMAGVALLIPNENLRLQKTVCHIIGFTIITIALLSLSQSIFHYNLGIDTMIVKPWIFDQNQNHGRTVGNVALTLSLIGGALMLLPHIQRQFVALLFQSIVFSVLILSISALLGYALNFHHLYDWYQRIHMTFYASITSSLTGMGLWSYWARSPNHQKLYAGKEDKKIVAISALTVLCLTLIVGSIFFLMLRNIEKTTVLEAIVDQTLPIILLIIVTGTLLFLWQIIPLVRKIIHSERNLRDLNSQLKIKEQELQHLAYHDSLTGLANRSKLEHQLEQLLSEAKRHHAGFALIFIDLDHFKNINDSIGHDAGDLLLQVISGRLKNTVRSTDIVARIGGDEFLVVITDNNKVDHITNIAQKILSNLLQQIHIKGHEVYITMSMGISIYPYDGHDIQTLLKNADLALYRAKDVGRNNFQFCTPEMTSKSREKIAKQNAIMQALAKNEFVLYYQPKFDLQHKKINGVEALLRWKSKEYGIVDAGEIIKLAEETGLILPLNDWVLKTACSQMLMWQSIYKTPLLLSVNLSGRQFKQASFADHLIEILKNVNYSPALLELDITEKLIMQDPDYVLKIVQTLKDLGISIAIDDFGTGYSSMDYLRRFAINKIKIDKSYVHRIFDDDVCASVVVAMIAMANKLNIITCAEGVETEDQLLFLLQEKCSEIQGYLFSKPLSVNDMTAFLNDDSNTAFLKSITTDANLK